MRRGKNQAIYKYLPKMWISDKDTNNNRSVTAEVNSWNYQKMENIYDRFIENEIRRQIYLFSLRGGDTSQFDQSDGENKFAIVEAARREGVPDIVATTSPLVFYCSNSNCHRAIQVNDASKVTWECPFCKTKTLKQLQLVYACECGYAQGIAIPKVKNNPKMLYLPTEKQYGMYYLEGKNKRFIEFGINCPICNSKINRDSAESGSNYKPLIVSVINLVNDKEGRFFDKGLNAQKIIVSKWFNVLSQDTFESILNNIDEAFNTKNTKDAKRLDAEKKARALVEQGIIPEQLFESTVATMMGTEAEDDLSVEKYVIECDDLFSKKRIENEENYNSWLGNYAFRIMQYNALKYAKKIISLEDSINRQIQMGFIDTREEVEDKSRELGIAEMQVSSQIEIINCAFGYTRKVSDPQQAKRSLRLMAYDKYKDTNKHLVYASRLETEGILFEIDRVKILSWLMANGIISDEQCPDLDNENAIKRWFAENVKCELINGFGGVDKEEAITHAVFSLLHEMSHAFMKTAGEMCGLAVNSLTEMIIIETTSIFIYSQTNQGMVLGALSGMAESRYMEFLRRCYEDNKSCAFDPICSERDDTACSACMVLAETSCKHFNANLGRKYLYSITDVDDKYKTGFWEM